MAGVLQNGVLVAIAAHGLVGFSLLWDKILLKQPRTRNLLSYVFWMGALNIFGLVLAFFGFHLPDWRIVLLGLAGGALDMIATYFYYWALKSGEASETLAVTGGFAPTATALIALPLLAAPLGKGESLIGFFIMTIGGFAMFGSEHMNARRILPIVFTASVTFGLANVVQKLVFNKVSFVTGYVLFTAGGALYAAVLLIRAPWRRQIFANSGEAEPRSRFFYLSNRVMAGVGAFLVFLAIKHSSPALVDAISGVRYVIIFLGALLFTYARPQWLKEDFTKRALLGKLAATGLIVAGLILVGLGGGSNAGAASP